MGYSTPVTRRAVLAGLIGTAAAGALPACAGGGTDAGPSGERLRVAFAAGGSQETLDPHRVPQFVDQARAKAVYDTLGGYEQDMSVSPRLAESWEPDDTGTRWRIRLREATWHDGRPVRAADVFYSYRRIADPATTASSQKLFSQIDFTASRTVSDRELELVLGAPNFVFPLLFAATGSEIVPEGTTDFANPIGSGPFTFVSFTPGGPGLYRRFDGHWDGAPQIAELEFVPMGDETARVGALLSGQVHYAHDLRATSAQQLESDARTRVLSADRSLSQFLYLKTDRPPFDDLRLRQAVQYGIDREALVEVAAFGRATAGNDMFGAGLEYYPSDLPQIVRDVDRARALVDEAGARGASFELSTGTTDPTWQPATALIVEQLAEIGLQVTPRAVPPDNYFAEVRQNAIAAHSRTGTLPIPNWIGNSQLTTSTATYTGYRNPEIDRLYTAALQDPDDRSRRATIESAMRLLQAESGSLVWGVGDWIVGISADVRGLQAHRPNAFRWANFSTAGLG